MKIFSASLIQIQVVHIIRSGKKKKEIGWLELVHNEKREKKRKKLDSSSQCSQDVMHQRKEIVFMHVDWSHLPTKGIDGQSF